MKKIIRLLIIIFLLVVSIFFGYKYLSKMQRVVDDNEELKIFKYEDNEIQDIYLVLNEQITLDNLKDEDDSEIISIKNNILKGISAGETTIYTDGITYNVKVTDLIDLPHVDNNKPFLSCNYYTNEENEIIDEYLKYYIDEAGYKTRAGALEAARFLLLRFKFKLNYFYENGRLDPLPGKDKVDGEGRYYHIGLYLSEDKLDDISYTDHGPCIWGCDLYEEIYNRYVPNGLDCSGFISWALYNAGYEVKDVGSGPLDYTYDLSDLGQKVYINKLKYEDLKAGDLIGFDGHIAMIIGIDDDLIYIGEAFWEGDLNVRIYSFNELKQTEWEYVMLMDDYYLADGNLTQSFK